MPLKRLAPVLAVALAAVALLGGASSGTAATQIVGGSAIRVQSAPWAVFIRQAISGGSLLCSGSILDSLHVLTAAHCVYDKSGAQASITSLSIKAGVSSYTTVVAGDAEQDRAVSSLRIHPAYRGPGSVVPDDVAILALSDPLDLSGPAVAAVALPAPGDAFPAGETAGIAGFGRQSSSANADGALYWLSATVDPQGSCGDYSDLGAAAVAVCMTSTTGSTCSGDSGGGLVTTAGTRTLVGVLDAGPIGCAGGGSSLFTYVGAPEILRFIQGDDHPPVAPRKTAATFTNLTWRGALRVGNTLTCASGDWDGSPAIVYDFVNSKDGTVLKHGPNGTYTLGAADVGATVSCHVVATNDGGVAVMWTGSTKPVVAAPRLGLLPVHPVAAVRGRTVSVRVVLYAPSDLAGRYAVCITPPTAVANRICASEEVAEGRLGGAFPFRLALRIKPTAPLGSSRLAINAVAGVSSGQENALVRVSGG